MTVPSLKLLSERKIGDLVSCDPPTKRWEASGVLVKDRHYFVVFDDRVELARVSDDLLQNDSNGLFGAGQLYCRSRGGSPYPVRIRR